MTVFYYSYIMSTPTVSTRAASRLALTHVLDNVMKHSNINSAFKKSQYEDITDILQLNDLTIKNLEYYITENNVTTTKSLPKCDMGMIRSFIHYVHHCSNLYDPIDNDWTTITSDMLDEFRTNLTPI
jgi:hypothetical protein